MKLDVRAWFKPRPAETTVTPAGVTAPAALEETAETQETAPIPSDVKAAEAARLRTLGIDDTRKAGPAGLGRSRILDVLGPERFASVPAVQVDGKVAWFNFALARELGFPVEGDTMTPALHAKILETLAYRALAPGEDPAGRPVVELHADRYGGTGLGANEGAGRAAFLPWGNLNIKGVGKTPLAKIKESEDFHHAHGGAPMREGLIEAVWGEVGSNLFTRGSSRILAIIDVGDFTKWKDGSQERRALIIRASHQMRPAHVLQGYDTGGAFSERVFVAMARELGLLAEVPGKSGLEPDLVGTMKNLVAEHARTQAEQRRWRVIHGALTTGNMQLDGAQLDLATMSTQPRTSNIKTLGHGGSFNDEQDWRTETLQRMYTAMQTGAGALSWRVPYFPVRDEMRVAFARELSLQMLDAVGLKPSMAQALMTDDRAMCDALTSAIGVLARGENGGDKLADKVVIEDSTVDVYNALRFYPEFLFSVDPGREACVAKMMDLLRPRVLGSEEHKATVLARIEGFAGQLVDALDAVYAAAVARADAHYDSATGMKRSIAQRAHFENEPIDALYKASAHAMFDSVVDEFGRTGDSRLFTEAIDKVAASSVRSFEALLAHGGQRSIEGGIEIQRRTIDGIGYAVRAFDDGKRRLHLSLPLVGDEASGFLLSTMPGAPRLGRADVEAMRYRFSIDGWKSEQEVQARLGTDDAGQPVLTFDIPALKSAAGRLEGVFHVEGDGGLWIKDGTANFRGYTFAIPDTREAAELASALTPVATG